MNATKPFRIECTCQSLFKSKGNYTLERNGGCKLSTACDIANDLLSGGKTVLQIIITDPDGNEMFKGNSKDALDQVWRSARQKEWEAVR